MEPQLFECRTCLGWYPLIFFRRFRHPIGSRNLGGRPRKCKGCRQTERDQIKARRRAPEKARKTLEFHSQRALKDGLASTVAEFIERFGWDMAQMAHDIEHAHANGCPYCLQPFSGMGHGLGDVTLDIIDPRLPPYYRTNVRWVCRTCNSEKGEMWPEEWEEILRCWRQWRQLQELEISRRWAPDSMFAGIEAS